MAAPLEPDFRPAALAPRVSPAPRGRDPADTRPGEVGWLYFPVLNGVSVLRTSSGRGQPPLRRAAVRVRPLAAEDASGRMWTLPGGGGVHRATLFPWGEAIGSEAYGENLRASLLHRGVCFRRGPSGARTHPALERTPERLSHRLHPPSCQESSRPSYPGGRRRGKRGRICHLGGTPLAG